jgi:Tol biopolymer transport system component
LFVFIVDFPAKSHLISRFMRETLRAKYIAAEIHALLFISMWVLYAGFSQPLADGPSSLPFVILLIADLPISLVAFGVMFTSSEMGTIAAALWGVLGTLWWFAIGFAIDARTRSYWEKHATGTTPFPATITANSVAVNSRRKELLISGSVVAVLVVSAIAWQWKGWQGHFDKGEIRSFTFAPDGRSILLVRSQDDSSRIEKVVLNSATSSPIGKALPCTASSPTYSPDGTRIAFECETKLTGLSRILVMGADGGNLHPLFSSNSNNYDFAPHFTPDGTEIYFGRLSSFIKDTGRGGAPPRRWDVYSASLDGKNERALTDRHFEDFGVSFSGDGRKFVLSGDIGSGTRLNLYSLDESSKAGTTIQPLIPNGPSTPVISNVALAPDGRRIYFMAASNGKKAFDYDVCRADLASKAVEKFTTANGYATSLSVSSDGKTAVFLRWTARWGSTPNLSKLYVLDMATKRVTALNVTGAQ